MSFPIPPLNNPDKNSRVWHLWFDQLRRFLSDAQGLIPWASINKSGAKLTDIPERFHNSLQVLQGGSTDERYHLSLSEYTELQRSHNVLAVSASTALNDTHRTALVLASGKTITLPAASSVRIGHDWTVILGVAGYVDIVRAGTDTLTLPEVSTSIRLDTKGTSVTLRCLTSSSWGIA